MLSWQAAGSDARLRVGSARLEAGSMGAQTSEGSRCEAEANGERRLGGLRKRSADGSLCRAGIESLDLDVQQWKDAAGRREDRAEQLGSLRQKPTSLTRVCWQHRNCHTSNTKREVAGK